MRLIQVSFLAKATAEVFIVMKVLVVVAGVWDYATKVVAAVTMRLLFTKTMMAMAIFVFVTGFTNQLQWLCSMPPRIASVLLLHAFDLVNLEQAFDQ